MKKILVTGGDGRFASELKKVKTKFKLIFCSKRELDICSNQSIRKKISRYKPNYVLHLAGLSRPMKIHEKNIIKSINLNIIGTANIVNECVKKKIKLIYISTNYGISVYDLEALEFGDTYYIGANGSQIQINQTFINGNLIYAATNTGLKTADINSLNLIDFQEVIS